jgi:hypothetical protein
MSLPLRADVGITRLKSQVRSPYTTTAEQPDQQPDPGCFRRYRNAAPCASRRLPSGSGRIGGPPHAERLPSIRRKTKAPVNEHQFEAWALVRHDIAQAYIPIALR